MIVQEYKMVASTTPQELTAKVNQLLQEGWKLYGFSSTATAGRDATYFVQPVIREVEQPGAWG
jgi:hypothetical protein